MLQAKTSSSSHLDAPLDLMSPLISSLLSQLIPSFAPTPRPTAAIFILHCKFSSSSLFLFLFLRGHSSLLREMTSPMTGFPDN
jgi:hypothetical protein